MTRATPPPAHAGSPVAAIGKAPRLSAAGRPPAKHRRPSILSLSKDERTPAAPPSVPGGQCRAGQSRWNIPPAAHNPYLFHHCVFAPLRHRVPKNDTPVRPVRRDAGSRCWRPPPAARRAALPARAKGGLGRRHPASSIDDRAGGGRLPGAA